jgi:hypothetical protein
MVTATVADKFGGLTYAHGYWVLVPNGYDPMKPLKVIFQGAGCDASVGGNLNKPLGGTGAPNVSGKSNYDYSKVDGGTAIQVGVDYGPPRNNCFNDQDPNSNDILFFPIVKKAIEAAFCVDTTNEFLSGYSSGSWWANQMTCVYGNQIRGAVEATGGEPPAQPTCVTGNHTASLFLHDLQDQYNMFPLILPACVRALKNNGCPETVCDATTIAAQDPYTPPAGLTIPAMGVCHSFKGCPADAPVVFCTTSNIEPGNGNHYIGMNAFIPPLFWDFINKY